MHSSKMGTVHCSGHLSCHKRMPPPPATHAPCHACPPALHTPLPCMPPCHTCPLPCMLPPPPPQWTEFLTHACENITFPQLLLQTVLTCWFSYGKVKFRVPRQDRKFRAIKLFTEKEHKREKYFPFAIALKFAFGKCEWHLRKATRIRDTRTRITISEPRHQRKNTSPGFFPCNCFFVLVALRLTYTDWKRTRTRGQFSMPFVATQYEYKKYHFLVRFCSVYNYS